MFEKNKIYLAILALAMSLLLAAAYPVAAADPVAVAVDEFLSTLPRDFYGLSPKGLKAALDAGEPMVVVDVREVSEFEAGHIEGAIHIPLRQLAKKLDQLPSDKQAPLAVICRTGGRSSYGTMALWLLGYRNLKNIMGGMQAWEKEGLPVVK
ncbi:MAG: rhodanese-like domain-containing protein [candidate division NC10 bacterium]|nr:rhodanese-like domain-containing protein [candidate division NC10 bacterium]